MRVGGGTSIMPRVAPTLYDFVGADDGEYLKVTEAVFRIFDRQDWLRVNRARARIKVFVDKFGIDELRAPGRGGAQGRLGRRARLRPVARWSSSTTRRPTRPAPPVHVSSPNGDSTEFDRFVEANVHPAAPGRASPP